MKGTKEIVKYAGKKAVLVEGELGIIRGESKFHQEKAEIEEKDLTSPEDAENFVKETKIDNLAVSVGNIHGIYSQMPKLDFERIKEISKVVKCGLVLHGGSGIPDAEIRGAIKEGIIKIHFNTELRLVWKNSLRKLLEESEESAPYKILADVQKDIQKKVEEKIILLGSSNKI